MGHPTYIREAGKKAQLSPGEYKAPSLAQALLKGAVNQYEDLKTPKQKELEAAKKKVSLQVAADFDKDLADLLTVIEERLRAGCGEAWLADEAYGAAIDRKAIEDKLAANPPSEEDKKKQEYWDKTYASIWDLLEFAMEPEEQWARAFSEMVLFAMYGNPGHIHLWKDDARALYTRYPDWYPLMMACQYLSTYAILSRGFPAADVKGGCACSAGTVNLDCFDTTEQSAKELGLVSADNPEADNADKYPPHKKSETSPELAKGKDKQETAPYFATTDILAKKQAGPGSVVSFNPGGPKYGGQDKGATTHIGTILRRNGTQVQFIDTGVLVGNGESGGGGGEGGTTDHSFCKGTIPAAKHAVGVGVLKPPPGDLVEATKKAAAAKPIGFSRLALVDVRDKGNPVVRFVSRMVHMSYPVSRYIWASRGLPMEGLRVIWMIYAPQGDDFAETLMNNPKNTPKQIWDTARPLWKAKKDAHAGEEGWNDKHQMTFFPTQFVRGEATGKAVIARHKVDKADGWVEDFEAPMDKDMPKKPQSENGQLYKMDVPYTLGAFATKIDYLDQQYICKPGEKGKLDETGGADFMKPK